MKVVLEFNDKDGESYIEHIDGPKAFDAIRTFLSTIRTMDKYQDQEVLSIDEVRELMSTCCEDITLY